MDFFDSGFWQAFVANAAATLFGVVLGIPAALWISNLQERALEKERKRKILKVLHKELFVNLRVLSAEPKSQNQIVEAGILSAVLRNESWRAFSDGGELAWIKDPALLDTIAEAYCMIRSVNEMSDKCYGMLMVDWEQFSGWTRQSLFGNLERAIVEAKEAIYNALKAIDSQRGN